MISKLALVIACGLGTVACAPLATDVAVVSPGVGVAGGAQWVAPGVQVVGGWQDPVFFADNGYWYWTDNGWMTWGGNGWMWGQPPVVLATGIRDPWRYRGWNGPWRGGQVGVRDHRRWNGGGPIVRDHRANRGGGWNRPPVQSSPGWNRAPVQRSSGWNRPPVQRSPVMSRPSGGGFRGGAVIRNHRR